MSTRTVHMHAFVSAKGGVGKSTLAVTCATLLASNENRKVVLIDADLTGTSLADGLRLCAPELRVGDDNVPDFFNPPTPPRYLNRAQTVALRKQRKNTPWLERPSPLPPPPPFLNDLLVRGRRELECKVEPLCWKHERDDRVLYLPSSPFAQDINIALGWLYAEEPFRWLQRMVWLLDDMRKQMPTLTDVVIDLPPGLFGFAHEVLALFSSLERGRDLPSGFPAWKPEDWKTHPFLVTTPDSNDLAIAMEYRIAHREDLPGLELLLNRYRARLSLEKWFAEWLPEFPGLYDNLELRVDVLPSLGELFTRGRLELSPEESVRLRNSMRLEVAA